MACNTLNDDFNLKTLVYQMWILKIFKCSSNTKLLLSSCIFLPLLYHFLILGNCTVT